MNAEERRKRIETYLHEVEFASLEELATQVNASLSTVRRDLTALEGDGNIRRTHGGARLLQPRSDEFSFPHRGQNQQDEKDRIGKACADLIESNQSVICDAGTTVWSAARHLEPKTPQIITNSLPVATHYASNNQLEVIVSGGVIYPRLGVLVGSLAEKAFQGMHVDVAIMGAGGLTEDGVTNSHVLLIDIQMAMMRAARKVILCLDASKIGRKSVTRLCGLDQIDILVTTAEPYDHLKQALKNHNVEIVVV